MAAGEINVRRLSVDEPEPDSARRPTAEWELAPKGVGELFDSGIELLRAHFIELLALSFAVKLVLALTSWSLDLDRVVEPSLRAWLTLAFALLAQFVGLHWLQAMCAERLHGELCGRPVELGRSILAGLSRTHVWLPASVMLTLAAILGCACAGVPMLLALWLFQPIALIAVIERTSFLGLFSRARSLARRSFWRWLGTAAILFAVSAPWALPNSLFEWPATRVWLEERLGLSPEARRLFVLGLSVLVGSVTGALSAAVWSTWYVEQRARREAFDLGLRLRAITGEARA